MRSRRLALYAGALVGAAGCGARPPAPPPVLRVAASANGSATRLTLLAAPRLRINARLAPALELPDGAALRFDGPRTADSAYFAAPPTAELPGSRAGGGAVHGRLRASVCRDDEQVCRSIALEL